MSSIPSRLKEAREAAGLTQEELARKIGSGRVSISRWETGQIEPSKHVLASIGYATSHNPDWLHTGEGPRHFEGAAESATAYRAEALDAELLRVILETVAEGLETKRVKLPPKVFATLIASVYEAALQEAGMREDLSSRIQPFIRLALAGAG